MPSPPSIELLAYEALLQSEHLAPAGDAFTDRAEQLAISLGRAQRRHRDEIDAWGQRFAHRYGPGLAAVSARARTIRMQDKLRKNLRKLTERFDTLRLTGDRRLPIRDVQEASVVAATVIGLRRA